MYSTSEYGRNLPEGFLEPDRKLLGTWPEVLCNLTDTSREPDRKARKFIGTSPEVPLEPDTGRAGILN